MQDLDKMLLETCSFSEDPPAHRCFTAGKFHEVAMPIHQIKTLIRQFSAQSPALWE